MEINLLRAFLALVETPNFGRASSLLNLSQPALSRQLGKLEAQLGGSLFSRGRHGAQLTELGRLFAQEARRLVEHADAVLERGRRIAAGELGELRIGFGSWAIDLVATTVPAFRERYPEVRVQVSDLPSIEQAKALADGSLDVAFMRLTRDRRLRQHRLASDYPAFVLPRDFPLADRAVSMKSVGERPLVLIARDRAPGFHAAVMALYEHHGIRPRIVQEAGEFHAVQALVAAGQGISLVPASVARFLIEGVTLRYVPASRRKWELGIAHRLGEVPLPAQRFVEMVLG
ncbi:LysR family transcriptional regulator [Burkholderia gladioli]|uniref:LysR family transcriptional regulator n=1 Tax=Burkholderia gladioli TaxID=28095 RepID=UPI0016410FAC|nr:LysR family transcriptional regulator [Burkholderia gladioli]